MGGAVDDFALFAAPLTAAEQDILFDTTRAWTWDMLPSAARTLYPVLKIGSSYVGPLRVGRS